MCPSISRGAGRERMSWMYRVVKHTLGDDELVCFDIREVLSNGSHKYFGAMGSKPPIGDTPDELRADLEMMLRAFDLPILEEKGNTLVEVKG